MPEPERPSEPLLAGRYRLRALLGRGAHGEVYEAEDTLLGGLCAVKRFDAASASPTRIRREISALRLLRIPGVVRLLDDGLDDGRPFLVMERVDGAPFPGLVRARSWESIASVTAALCETLSRVHAAGVVHRDLKPANVLVDGAGRPTVLDFGVAGGAALGEGLTVDGRILGTPAYLAPEQIRGEPVTARTDLYSLGIMLHEALTGRLPHEADSWQGLLRSRLARRPPPVGELAPRLPVAVAATIDALLEVAPEDRPASAGEVLARISGRVPETQIGSALPLLGDDEGITAACAALRSGRSVDIVGPRRSGRTRALSEVCARLSAEGREAVPLVAARRAFASLAPVCGPLEGRDGVSLRDVTAEVERAVSAAQARGVILVADDAERLDRWSAAVLEAALERGGVLRVFRSPPTAAPPASAPSVVALRPLAAADLTPLFTGTDRIFHLRSDAATALHVRTGGLAGEVAAEVLAWVRAGIARWDRERLAVDRDGLERLEVGLGIELRAAGEPEELDDPRLSELCALIALAAPHAAASLLARATGQPLFRVEEALEELSAMGMVEPHAGGTVSLRRRPAAGLTEERRRDAHRALARLLPRGAEGRLWHLLAGEEAPAAVAEEAFALAEELATRGRLGRAVAVLSEGLLAARRRTGGAGAPREEEQLLSLWLDVALEETTATALDRVLYEISRSAARSAVLSGLEGVARAAIAALTGSGDRAQTMIEAIPPFQDPAVERRRQEVRVLAARRAPVHVEERVVEQAVSWSSLSSDPRIRAAAAGWLGRLRYRQERFEEAARSHAEAAHLSPWLIARIAAQLSSASALMEAGRLDDALSLAGTARALAEQHRQPRYEARAEWLIRSVGYRLNTAGVPDLELCDLAARTGVPEMEAFVCLNEAAVAFRAENRSVTVALAERARCVWESLGKPWTAALAAALAAAAGGASPQGPQALAAQGLACPSPTIGLQIAALASSALPGDRASPHAAHARALALSVPASRWAARMEVLSVEEALALLERGEPPGLAPETIAGEVGAGRGPDGP